MENRSNNPGDWPISRLVSFASMMLTFVVVLFFILIAITLNYFQPDLGDQPLLLPLMGAVLVAGSMMASLGLVAGVIDLSRSKDRRGVSVVAVLINGAAALFVFSITVVGMLR